MCSIERTGESEMPERQLGLRIHGIPMHAVVGRHAPSGEGQANIGAMGAGAQDIGRIRFPPEEEHGGGAAGV